MRLVSYIVKGSEGKFETKSYTKATEGGNKVLAVKLTDVRDPEDNKAVEALTKFWRKNRG
jgi:hypothetical protein